MNEQTVPTTNGLAIVSLVFGVLGWTLLPFIGMIVAIITGHIALGQVRRSSGAETGEGLAIAGLVLGYLALAVGFIVLVMIVFAIGLIAFLA
jgi:hypothetical protein